MHVSLALYPILILCGIGIFCVLFYVMMSSDGCRSRYCMWYGRRSINNRRREDLEEAGVPPSLVIIPPFAFSTGPSRPRPHVYYETSFPPEFSHVVSFPPPQPQPPSPSAAPPSFHVPPPPPYTLIVKNDFDSGSNHRIPVSL